MTPTSEPLPPVDFDLHGIVGVRLIDATARDAAVVTRQLGPIQAALKREPDVTIRFVDRLSTSSTVRFVGEDAGFTDDAFLVLRGKHKTRARVQIPFDRIGQSCEIVCERGVPAVPLLIAIVNLTVLAKGILPMHASAFNYRGVGVLLTGWAKGGKTEALLAFMAKGAEYVGDEWIYLTPDGQRMYGIPEPIRLWNWQLESMPQYWSALKRGDRLKLRSLNLGAQMMDAAASAGRVRSLRSVAGLVKRQLNVQIPPHKLFGHGVGSRSGCPQKVFYIAAHDSPDVITESVDAQEIAGRMVYSLQQERSDLLAYYLNFRFAFPGARNALLDEAENIQRDLLRRALDGKPAYAVYHPYPLSIPRLYDAMNPLVSG